MSDAIALNSGTLSDITRADVPSYDRAAVRTRIAHIGVGGFHRSHEAMYVDRLLAAGSDWGICGIGIRPADAAMRDALVPQDGLYTLTLKHPDGDVQTSVIGSIVDFLLAPDDPDAVLDVLSHPDTAIVSLTVTEGGYNFSPATGEFDLTQPDVAHDLEPDAVPTTVFGFVTSALRRRRDRGIASFTVVSCDNIAGNGDVARETFGAFARAQDPELAQWIADNTAFPNSMVDRITPATPLELRAEVRERTGVDDRWPVVAEPFTQWVLEDSFSSPRPPFEDVGVQVVADVTPYELMKLRLLNAGHQSLCYFGHLLGYRYVHDAAADADIAELLRRYWDSEARPTLMPLEGIDLDEYTATLLDRFGNPAIADTVARLCQDSSDRIPKWLVPVIRERLDADGDVSLAAAVVASWTRYAEGTDEAGAPIDVVDPLAATLTPLALRSRSEPLAFVRERSLFGDLADREEFTAPYLAALESLRKDGARRTLSLVLGH
ncbi:mannitol dehydrogenase family protein [Rhodococcus rhodnii]|uniref:Mannitol 2-dehydrogenase n=2 Tax=Rhodococcus rhodnii TaxID=38312 RepID=R7WI48_9NOCA|nr:mannitol dehydrogenase family protein [Rhodococcus rhodnii]EOM74843.1 mannitol 2-dehydrogenase [Rhodococcus rhodnii LMG 5362]TXG90984.1 mannitol dehydrogenase family protein [Rhodococcus rhodnii]